MISDTARMLHAEAPAIDLHADPLLWTRFFGYDLNKRHSPPLPGSALGGHVDVPRMLEGGMGAQFFGLVSLPLLDADFEQRCHQQIDDLQEAVSASGGRLRIATDAEELSAVPGCIAALMGIEGAHALHGDITALERFAKRGVRYLGLLHFTANECGVPAYGWGADPLQGLTAFGKQVVEYCEELGVIVDLSHINKRGFMQACAMASRPLIVSHTGLAGVFPLWRNIDDEQLKAVADGGGVVGVIFCPAYLGSDGLDAVVAHLRHIIKVAGEDSPALGSDWDGFIQPTTGLEEASKLPQLTTALLDSGVPSRVVKKIMRDNALRVLHDVPFRARQTL